MLFQLSRTEAAASAYRDAEALAPNPVERRYLRLRRESLGRG